MPPLGLAYLAAAMRAAGHRVTILDGRAEGLSWRGLEARLVGQGYDLVGVTAMSPVRDLAARTLRLARPHARFLAVGGPHPTAVGEAVFDDMPEADLSLEGEAETSGPEVLAWLQAGGEGPPPAGVRAPGKPFVPLGEPTDLDELPEPSRDLLPQRGYHHLLATRRPMTTAITSRGCPHSCTFCDRGVGGGRWRARSPSSVLNELDRLAASGVRFVHFYDDNFTHDRDRVAAICEGIIARGLDLAWNCEARVDGVDGELLRLMRRAGCQLVAFGVESAWSGTLSALCKGFDRQQIVRAFADAKAARLRTLAYVILGAPGEGSAQIDATLRFVRHLGADFVQFSTLSALPGAPLGRHGSPGGDVRSFLDADGRRDVLSDLPPHELARWLRLAWGSFYLRPTPLLRLSQATIVSGAWVEAPRIARVAASWLLGGR